MSKPIVNKYEYDPQISKIPKLLLHSKGLLFIHTIHKQMLSILAPSFFYSLKSNKLFQEIYF